MKQSFIEPLVFGVVSLLCSAPVFAHTADDGSPQSLLSKRVEKKGPQASDGFQPNAVEGVVDEFRLWQTGSTLKACFFNGTDDLKTFFVGASAAITDIANLKFDFGSAPAYNRCDGGAYHLRIAFDHDAGNWSYVGTDSIRVSGDKPSINIGYGADSEFSLVNKSQLNGVILHELGHAIALQHEHQSPEAHCDGEFDWPKIYASFQQNYGWDKAKVDQNLRMLTASPRLRATAYDRSSIMHYYFPAWMYTRGAQSSCFVHENLQLSATDKDTIKTSYPATAEAQVSLIQERSNLASTVLKKLVSTDEQKAWANDLIDQAAQTAAPGVVLNVSSVTSSSHDGSEENNTGACAGARIQITTGDHATTQACTQ